MRMPSARFSLASVAMSAIAEESYRTYPCPECNQQTAAEEKVAILYAASEFKRDPVPDGAKPDIAMSLARSVADKLLTDGLIEIVEEKRGDDTLFLAKCAVVSPKVATRIEKRAYDAMKGVLEKVAEAAERSIAVWGSHYTGREGMISKGQAIDYMRASFDAALKEHEEKK